MPEFKHGDIRIETDEQGFIVSAGSWSEAVARALAASDGIAQLTDDHWKVINYLRDYYGQFGIAPMVRKLCKDTGFTLKEIYAMFPAGPANGACKIAGLAKPTGCV